MTELPRYKGGDIFDSLCIAEGEPPDPLGTSETEWVKASDHDAYVADISSRLQQLEMEKAGWQEWAHWTFEVPRAPTLTLADLRQAMCVNVDARENALKAKVEQLEQEKATLQEEIKELRARVDSQRVNREAVVPRPPIGA